MHEDAGVLFLGVWAGQVPACLSTVAAAACGGELLPQL